jgi:hypothetical protein
MAHDFAWLRESQIHGENLFAILDENITDLSIDPPFGDVQFSNGGAVFDGRFLKGCLSVLS